MLNWTGLFSDIEIDLAGSASDITKIGIGHFPGTVHDTSHDRDADSLQMTGRLANFLGGRLEIEQGSPATRDRPRSRS